MKLQITAKEATETVQTYEDDGRRNQKDMNSWNHLTVEAQYIKTSYTQ